MKSIKPRHVFLLLVWVLCSGVYAQRDTTKFVPKRPVPKATLKFNVAALANLFRSSLFVSGDVYLNRNMAIDIGAGWFFGSVLQEYRQESFTGLRQRLGYKYLFLSDRKASPYVGLELKLNYIREQRIENVSRYGGQYTEEMLLTKKTRTYGAAFRGGVHIIPGRNRRFILDIYSGFGYKYTHVTMPIPDDAELFLFENMIPLEKNPGRYHLPDFLLGVNIGYCFR